MLCLADFADTEKRPEAEINNLLVLAPKNFGPYTYSPDLVLASRVMYKFCQVSSYLLSTLEMIYDLSGQT